MKNPLKYGVIGLLASTAVLISEPTIAQDQNPARPGKSVQSPSREYQYGPNVSVNFPGGELAAYISALQQAAGDEPVNVVVPEAAKSVVLPPIMLRNVTMYTALSAVCSAFEVDSEHEFNVHPVGRDTDATFAIRYIRNRRTAPNQISQPGQKSSAPEKRLQVYSIRDLIEPPAGTDGSPQAKVAYESILSAVEAAMGMFEESDSPKLMYHKETGLLLVGGTPYQTDVVDNMIQRLRDDLQRRWSEERSSKKLSVEQQRRLAMAKTELQIAEKELMMAEEQAHRSAQLAEQGAISREEVSQARLNVDRARAMFERRKIELDAATDFEENVATASSVVVYSITDVMTASPNLLQQLDQTVTQGGGTSVVRSGADGKPSSIVVTGSETTHAAVAKLLDELRTKKVNPTGK